MMETVKKNRQKGVAIPALLIVTASFVIVMFGLLLILSVQLDYSHREVASEEALHIAEAGINYYRWHLAHAPEDYQDGTGGAGPYHHDYSDPQGNLVGGYDLEITEPIGGSSLVTIQSTGYTNEFPNVKRTITAQYGKPSYARYSFLSNASLWYGEGMIVHGEIHSNNGIRMDGINTSMVTSAKETYRCGWETGCQPPDWRPGIWGVGPNSSLWQFPVPAVDFGTISFDLANLRASAINEGLYLDESGEAGYHIIFSDNGTFTVYRVTATNYIDGYSVPGVGLGGGGQGGCRRQYQLIDDEELVGTYNVESAHVIFAEDDVVWVEGTLRGRLTLAAATFPIQSSSSSIWIKDNITYTAYDGTDMLALISQGDIYFAKDVPDYFQIDAVLMSQEGSVIRHGYFDWCGGSSGAVKQRLTINGGLISNDKSYWNFGSGPESGFIEREIFYDTGLLYDPPPYFPTTEEYEFVSWKEE